MAQTQSSIMLNEQDLTVLRSNPLFRGLEPERFERQLKVMKAAKAHSKRGEMLQVSGEPIVRFGIVLSGAVRVCVDDIEGNRMILNQVTSGGTFGESLCFLGVEDPGIRITASGSENRFPRAEIAIQCINGSVRSLRRNFRGQFTGLNRRMSIKFLFHRK